MHAVQQKPRATYLSRSRLLERRGREDGGHCCGHGRGVSVAHDGGKGFHRGDAPVQGRGGHVAACGCSKGGWTAGPASTSDQQTVASGTP